MIVIVDYKIGNPMSVRNMLAKGGHREAVISGDAAVLRDATKIILPGVGHFDAGMRKLRGSGLYDLLNEKVLEQKTPVLGICLGAEMLTKGSDEGTEKGLGWIDAHCRRFEVSEMSEPRSIPNMGWLDVRAGKASRLTADLPPEPRFYFTHSFHIVCFDPSDRLLTADYGYEFTAAVERGNVFGTQFHPEKSHKYGMKLLANFAAL